MSYHSHHVVYHIYNIALYNAVANLPIPVALGNFLSRSDLKRALTPLRILLIISLICRVGQNRAYTPYVTVYLMVSHKFRMHTVREVH